MAYVPVPKDLAAVKTKVLFNLTKRQLICFGSGALVGIPLFFLIKGSLGNTTAALCMMLVMLPFFLFAMYEKNGQPLEKIAHYFIEARFRRSKKRPFKTNNLYTALHKQADFDKEVKAIVRASVQKKRKAGNTPA